ncbi:hypothetical protein AL073_07560 [Loktanella sp. 1ANDIMAR09]|uniref:PH domain-containing protein n=1 Tax=Yoonia rosea TaxID=287098 RepID=A0A1R3X2T4_9RHOB|nr:hypothetical protein [Yoonia rosea]KQB96941.1 hypothetical protein AL073_07560 [Loktanella sp. 1ANDIMAR09]SIT84945.1 hypothetical protein SAMN05421665_1957 [Yoonia rosea]
MKIVHNTPEKLVLTFVPWVFATVLSALLLGVVGFGLNALFTGDVSAAFWGLLVIPAFVLLFLVIFVRRDDLILDRDSNLLELRHSTFLGRTRVQHRLEHLREAKLQSSRSESANTYRIALVLDGGMDAGTHAVTPIYINGPGPERGVAAINAWLAQDVDSAPPQA